MKIYYTKYAVENKKIFEKDEYLSMILSRLENAIKSNPNIKKSAKSPLILDENTSIDLFYRSSPSRPTNYSMYVYFIVINDEIYITDIINSLENPDVK